MDFAETSKLNQALEEARKVVLAAQLEALQKAQQERIAAETRVKQREQENETANLTSLVRSSLAEHDANAPLSEATKIRRFAALSFCCLTSTRRQWLTAAELANLVTGVNGSDADTPYYATIDQTPARIGFLRVDLAGNGRWDRIVAKCQQDVRDHADDRVWAPWILANRFEVTLVTTLPHKAERLHRELSRQDHAPPIPVRIAVIPDLLYLIAPHLAQANS